jgi:hypothetical protein
MPFFYDLSANPCSREPISTPKDVRCMLIDILDAHVFWKIHLNKIKHPKFSSKDKKTSVTRL